MCVHRPKRIVHLGRGENALTHVRMAGRFVALRDHYDSGAPDPCYALSVSVFDVTKRPEPSEPFDEPRGLLLPGFDESRFNCSGRPEDEHYNLPTSIVLKGNGAVAYVRCFSSDFAFGGPYRCALNMPRQVIKHDARARRNTITILDSGLDIATQSLRLNGGTLTWRHGQRRRTARLR